MANDINHFAGDTLPVSCPLTDANGDPMTGVSRAWMGVRNKEGDEETVWGPEEGTVEGTTATFMIDKDLTADMQSGKHWFAIRCLKENGEIKTVVKAAYQLQWPVITNSEILPPA